MPIIIMANLPDPRYPTIEQIQKILESGDFDKFIGLFAVTTLRVGYVHTSLIQM